MRNMITLTADQEFFHPGNFLVKTTGTYSESDLVVVYARGDATKAGTSSFQASFIAYGVQDTLIEEAALTARDLVVNNQITLANAQETTLMPAGGENVFNDLSSITYRIVSRTTTITIRDQPGGSPKLILTGEANTTNQLKFDPPLNQAVANQNWTAQQNESNTSSITAICIQN